MSLIKRITVQAYSYELEDFGPGSIYQKGGRIRLSKFIVSIETDDGLNGSYAPHFGATQHALAQVREMARGHVGQDAEQRERIFERLKLNYRHFDKVGIGALDAALWDLAGRKYGAPVSRLLGGFRERLPVYASTAQGQKAPGGLDSVGKYADFAEACKEHGIPAFKIHGFFDGNVETEIALLPTPRRSSTVKGHHAGRARTRRRRHEADDRPGLHAPVFHGRRRSRARV